MAKDKANRNVEIINRKARFEFQFLSVYEAGIMLTGTEVKSVRAGHAHLKEAHCRFRGNELFIHNMHIAEYKFGNQHNHEPRRVRKLLLHKPELRKLHRRVKEKGFTIVPYRLYLSERNLIKIEITLAQGKRAYDKRHTIKERENKRDLNRLNKIQL